MINYHFMKRDKESTLSSKKKNAQSSERPLDNAQFPCYGVTVVYKNKRTGEDERVIEESYPEGKAKPRFFWESDEEYEMVDPPYDD